MAADELSAEIPVRVIIGSETVQILGQEKITVKQRTCGALVAELEDNHLWLPPERYVREDWRLVKKEKGQFVCEPDLEGRHGDTFDAARFAVDELASGDMFAPVVFPNTPAARALFLRRDRTVC